MHACSCTCTSGPNTCYSTWQSEEHSWEGFLVEFAAADLLKATGQQIKVRNTKDSLWNALQNNMLATARLFDQFALYEWYPARCV